MYQVHFDTLDEVEVSGSTPTTSSSSRHTNPKAEVKKVWNWSARSAEPSQSRPPVLEVGIDRREVTRSEEAPMRRQGRCTERRMRWRCGSIMLPSYRPLNPRGRRRGLTAGVEFDHCVREALCATVSVAVCLCARTVRTVLRSSTPERPSG